MSSVRPQPSTLIISVQMTVQQGGCIPPKLAYNLPRSRHVQVMKTASRVVGTAIFLEGDYAQRGDLELGRVQCPKCARKLGKTSYNDMHSNRCIGCGGVWLDLTNRPSIAHDGSLARGVYDDDRYSQRYHESTGYHRTRHHGSTGGGQAPCRRGHYWAPVVDDMGDLVGAFRRATWLSMTFRSSASSR